jgi:peptide/nickel transport system substrate-binding protein
VFRQAFSESIDRQAIFNQIYAPIFSGAGMQGKLLDCGAIVEGPYCPPDNFKDTYQPENAAKILTDAGWKKNGQGFWAKDGQDAPKIRWMITTGNKRRESTQDFLIPLLTKAGFQVVAENCEADCVFQQRLPALDYDLAMYINNVQPDPTYLIALLTCDNVPTPENGNKGQNYTGWCNQKASDELHESDVTADQAKRTDLIQDALRATDTDHVMLPLVNFPNSAAWLPKAVGGPVDANLSNFRGAFSALQDWTDQNGDGQIVIGAEQWPSCLNLVTECANSSWYVWTVSFLTQPAIWDPTEQQTFEITNLVTKEPEVKVL